MEPRDLRLELPAAAADVLGGYLTTLDAGLPVGRRDRAAIIAEVGDGLASAVDAKLDRGADPDVAARQAVAEFGDPGDLAHQFASQLMLAHAHRLGGWLLLSGPVVGGAWIAAVTATGSGSWTARISETLAAVAYYPLVLAITVPAAIVALAAGGRLAWRLPLPAGLVTGAVVVATLGCVLGDVSLLATFLLAGEQPIGSVAVVALLASVGRLGVTALAGRRVLLLRAAGK